MGGQCGPGETTKPSVTGALRRPGEYKDASTLEVVEVGLHVEAVEEMLQGTPTRRIGIGISISRPSGLGQRR